MKYIFFSEHTHIKDYYSATNYIKTKQIDRQIVDTTTTIIATST